MNISVQTLPAGTYIVAVSGGVDSMVLLELLMRVPKLQLVVAHFDHGIREDSALDEELVRDVAAKRGQRYVSGQGQLGAGASEAQAREARYAFLRRAKETYRAQAIVTAHHQDDLIETAILNMLRGTHRRGLSSLRSSPGLVRPLLATPKTEILAYAAAHRLVWREDSTNHSDDYLRNYIRRHYMTRLDSTKREQLLHCIAIAAQLNPVIDDLLQKELDNHTQGNTLNRQWFIMLPFKVSCEVMAAWLRQQGIQQFDKRMVGRLVVAAKTDYPGKKRDVSAGFWLEVGKTGLRLHA